MSIVKNIRVEEHLFEPSTDNQWTRIIVSYGDNQESYIMNDIEKQLLFQAIMSAINKVGMTKFKQTSLFGRNN